MKTTQVDFIDLIVLAVITLHCSISDAPPTQKELYSKRSGWINNSLQLEHIDPIYAAPLTSNTQLMHSIETLRSAGLLKSEGSYIPTEAGIKLLTKGRLGPEARMWPISIDITADGEPVMKSANYLPEI